MSPTTCLLCRAARLTVRGSLIVRPLVVLLTVALAPAITIGDSGSLSVGVAAASAAQLTATWTDNAGGTANFKVERKTGTAGTYTEIATTAAGATSYVDTMVAAGITYCYRVRASNADGDSDYSNEACGLVAASSYDVTVEKAGTGSGTVTSSPAGIDCGSDCFESFAAGTVVTLTPTEAMGSVFTGWSAGGCTGTSQCVTTGNAPVSITATFSSAAQSSPPPSTSSYTLTTTKSGTGWGTVESSSGSIQCGSVCAESVEAGTAVTLTAAPGKGATFTGWSGAGCGGTGTCTVKVSGNTSVDAAFTTTTYSSP